MISKLQSPAVNCCIKQISLFFVLSTFLSTLRYLQNSLKLCIQKNTFNLFQKFNKPKLYIQSGLLHVKYFYNKIAFKYYLKTANLRLSYNQILYTKAKFKNRLQN